MELFNILIYYPLINLLTFLIWLTPGHYAASGIILLTLLVRFILLIPSKRAAQTQRRMQQLAPLIAELKVEYGDDKQGLAVAQMDLYKKNGVNPFGNCVTLLIQLPILITLYSAIRNGLTANNPHIYQWLSQPTFIDPNFFGISLLNPDPTYLIPVVAAIAQYIQIKMTLPAPALATAGTQDPAVATQRMMLYLIPILTVAFASSLPAGVALYWVVTTLFGIVQQAMVNREKYSIEGVGEALKVADVEHPEHKPRTEKVLKQIAEETSTKKGVTVKVRKRSGSGGK
jgi:YidC/Oxa1 family membrane protein insertase